MLIVLLILFGKVRENGVPGWDISNFCPAYSKILKVHNAVCYTTNEEEQNKEFYQRVLSPFVVLAMRLVWIS